mgnify:CR=1
MMAELEASGPRAQERCRACHCHLSFSPQAATRESADGCTQLETGGFACVCTKKNDECSTDHCTIQPSGSGRGSGCGMGEYSMLYLRSCTWASSRRWVEREERAPGLQEGDALRYCTYGLARDVQPESRKSWWSTFRCNAGKLSLGEVCRSASFEVTCT